MFAVRGINQYLQPTHIRNLPPCFFSPFISSPKDAVLALWGSFDVDRMAKRAQKVFADWGSNPSSRRAGGVRFAPIAEEGYAAREPGVYLVDKPGLTQG